MGERTVLYSTVQRTVVCCTALYYTAVYCTVLYCTVLYCTVLYCRGTVLYCTVLCLYCTVLHFFEVCNGFRRVHPQRLSLDTGHGTTSLFMHRASIYGCPSVLHCSCTVLRASIYGCPFCTALYLYCTVLHCLVHSQRLSRETGNGTTRLFMHRASILWMPFCTVLYMY